MGKVEISKDMPRGWYSRGYLPHRDRPGLLQAISYRLADSLPADVLANIKTKLHSLPTIEQDNQQRVILEEWLDKGYGSCILRNPEVAECVVDTWRKFDGERYDLIAWVVMPNHVHVLIRAYDGQSLGKIVQSWKSFTGRKFSALTEKDSVNGIWMREYWDRYIRSEKHFVLAIDYIHQNPVNAGLVSHAQDWQWSSAAAYSPLGTPSPSSANKRPG